MGVPAANLTPNGCVIGLAEEIMQAIARCEYGPKKNRFAVMVWSSFKQAGWQKGPEAGLRYTFDMDTVCTALNTTQRTVANMRNELEQDGLFQYIPNKHDYRTGWIVWNPAYQDWLRLQPNASRHGGKRAGAGNPNWKATRRTPLDSEARERTPLDTESLSSGVRLVGETLSSGVRQPAITPFKRCTLPSLDAAPVQAAIVESKKGTEEEYTEEETYIAPAHAGRGEQASLFPIASEAQKPKAADGSKKERTRDELWDAAVHVFGFSPEGSAAGLWGKKLALMRKRSVPVTPDELIVLAAAYQRKYPNATFSLAAIESHVDDLRNYLTKKGASANDTRKSTNPDEPYTGKYAYAFA